VLHTKYYSADQVKKNEMSRACGMGEKTGAFRKKFRAD
jgi:hypothetical protein